jgi:hypothetical protein
MANYTVLDTRHTQRVTPSGKTREVYLVDLETDLGSTGRVEVEGKNWTADKLAEILQDAAEMLDLAFTVSSDS